MSEPLHPENLNVNHESPSSEHLDSFKNASKSRSAFEDLDALIDKKLNINHNVTKISKMPLNELQKQQQISHSPIKSSTMPNTGMWHTLTSSLLI